MGGWRVICSISREQRPSVLKQYLCAYDVSRSATITHDSHYHASRRNMRISHVLWCLYDQYQRQPEPRFRRSMRQDDTTKNLIG